MKRHQFAATFSDPKTESGKLRAVRKSTKPDAGQGASR
jgi:hypothetical protein